MRLAPEPQTPRRPCPRPTQRTCGPRAGAAGSARPLHPDFVAITYIFLI